jgi:uncharacterized membrane protein YoaK (UPF0700 family)
MDGSRRPAWTGDYIAHPKHGPLPALLLVMTIVTGLVDAVSILALGRVFVANMTGNVVFIGFALAGAPGFSLSASVAALAGFLIGASIGGGMAARTAHRGRLLGNIAAVELALLVVTLILLGTIKNPDQGVRVTAAFLVAVAMGGQNAVVRKLAVPDLTTTVLTMTLTGIAADIRTASYAVAIRRTVAVICMFAGAVLGAVLVLHVNAATAIAVAAALMAIVVIGAMAASRQPAPWQEAP